jgi:hypothetical protein
MERLQPPAFFGPSAVTNPTVGNNIRRPRLTRARFSHGIWQVASGCPYTSPPRNQTMRTRPRRERSRAPSPSAHAMAEGAVAALLQGAWRPAGSSPSGGWRRRLRRCRRGSTRNTGLGRASVLRRPVLDRNCRRPRANQHQTSNSTRHCEISLHSCDCPKRQAIDEMPDQRSDDGLHSTCVSAEESRANHGHHYDLSQNPQYPAP